MSHTPKTKFIDCGAVGDGVIVEKKSEDVFHAEIAKGAVDETRKAVDRVKTLVDQMNDAKAALDIGTSSFQRDWFEWVDASKNYLNEHRMWAQAMNREFTQAKTAMQDVRDMLGTEKHAQTMANLRELIELCERAKKLKESGFLDAVVDTLIKLP